MLGQTVSDPDGIEGSIAQLPGLGLLSIDTTMTADKTTRQVVFDFEGHSCQGYEIHQGVSTTDKQILREGSCIGTYIHGFLDNAPVIDSVLKPFCKTHAASQPAESLADFRNRQYDLLADHVRRYVDIDKIYDILAR